MQRLFKPIPQPLALALAFAALLVLPHCWLIEDELAEDGLTGSDDQKADLPPITAKQGSLLLDFLAR